MLRGRSVITHPLMRRSRRISLKKKWKEMLPHPEAADV
jgi:hypothetical protein